MRSGSDVTVGSSLKRGLRSEMVKNCKFYGSGAAWLGCYPSLLPREFVQTYEKTLIYQPVVFVTDVTLGWGKSLSRLLKDLYSSSFLPITRSFPTTSLFPTIDFLFSKVTRVTEKQTALAAGISVSLDFQTKVTWVTFSYGPPTRSSTGCNRRIG